MNGNGIDHERISARLDDFVDGELSARERRELEAHVEVCAACRADVESRRALRDQAAAVPRSIEPDRDLWPDIRSRLKGQELVQRAERADPAGLSGRARRWRPRPLHAPATRSTLAAAATVLLVAGGAALTVWLSGNGDPAGAPRSADRTGAGGRTEPDPVALVADWRSLEGEYVGAAEELQQALDEIGNELAPGTRRIVEDNLRVIDEAIAESRAALERDPANRELERALRAAWSSKVEMLQYVTRL